MATAGVRSNCLGSRDELAIEPDVGIQVEGDCQEVGAKCQGAECDCSGRFSLVHDVQVSIDLSRNQDR